MWTSNFWRQAAERAVKTAAQALLGVWVLDGFNVLTTDWLLLANTALGAAAISVLTSVATVAVGEPDDPAAVRRQ